MSLISRLFGGSPPPEPRLNLEDGAEEGWGDCAFEATRRGNQVEARARFRGEVVGFSVRLPSRWEKLTLEPDSPFSGFRGIVQLVSRGAESDRFVQALAERYVMPAPAARMVPRVACTGITLAGDPRSMNEAAVRVKLFFAEDDEERYAEAFLNLLLPINRLEFNEKDEDYRGTLLQALTVA